MQTNTEVCTNGGHSFLFSASLYNNFLQSYKANRVVAEIRVNTGCWDVCVVSD